MYLFFDTETTGLPKNYKAPVSDSHNWPRMVQIAWQVYDGQGNFIESQDYIIKPEGYHIPVEASKIHGISTEKAINEGHNLQEVLEKFNQEIENAQTLVAHNISFDEKIVGAEFYRKAITNKLNIKPKLCTMKQSADYCKIPGNYGFKWPKLSELHQVLFKTGFEEAHNAAADIKATVKCFWKLKEVGVI
jgi:DNA polymerase III epsilon subunit-like protein